MDHSEGAQLPKEENEDEEMEDSEDWDSSSVSSVEALAPNRSRRGNAGAKMASLLNAEEVDEFYADAYGGFNEEEGDDEFDASEGDDDEVDSDFDIEEVEETPEQEQDDEANRKRPRGVVTKAYKEPLPKKPASLPIKKPRIVAPSEPVSTGRQLRLHPRPQETMRVKSKKIEKSRKKQERQWTQEELLKEAQKTEKVNLAALNTYRELEMVEKLKRSKTAKKVKPSGPRIIEVSRADARFVVFPSDFDLRSSTKTTLPIPSQPRRCVVTGLPARYIDPFTKLPYHNLQAFKTIRSTYKEFLSTKSTGANHST